MPIHTKEQWKEKTLEFLKENSDRIMSIKDICNVYGLIPIELVEAVEELERERKCPSALGSNLRDGFSQ